MLPPRFLLTVLIPCLFALPGCDDAGDGQGAAGKGIKVRQSQVKPVAIGGNSSKKSDSAAKKKPEIGVRESQGTLPPGVSPDDVFRVSTETNEYEITATREDRNTFTVVGKPEPGADSRTFRNPAIQEYDPNRRPTRVTQPRRTVGGSDTNQKTLPAGFTPISGVANAENGLPKRVLCDVDGSELILIEEGPAPRGTNAGPEDTQPQHTVLLDDYYIGLHEVTVEQYKKFRAAARDDRSIRQVDEALNAAEPYDHPVVGVSQFDALKYTEWAKCSLPSEAQWEKAARGPQGFVYPWGNGRPVWPTHREPAEVAPIMSYRVDVSTYGVYDMAGNAREWCRDIYRADAYSAAGEAGQKLLENPLIETVAVSRSGTERVIRGNAPDWKLWYRSSGKPTDQVPGVGFRLVLNIPDAPPKETSDRRSRRD